MLKTYNKQFNETYYTKKLDNGLTVILFEKANYHSNFFTLITPYGSNDFQQVDALGNAIHLPPGVAHFLEHRMFDYAGIDVMERFSELGSSSNASTGYDQTQYYFSTTSDDFKESLELLINFVFNLKIPEATVEKEKGIIIEELNMYDGMADFKLYFGLIKNLYHHLPYTQEIGGSIESVSNTTLQQLETAYKYNYHPEQMFLVGATNNNIEETFAFIESTMSEFTFAPYMKMSRDYAEEPLHVRIAEESVVMDINSQKVALGYKFKHGISDVLEIDKMEILFDIYFDLLFSAVNENYQTWLDQQLINDYFDVEVSLDKDFGHLIISGEHDDLDRFKVFVEDILNNDEQYLIPDKFEQLKKKFIGRAIMALEQPATIAQVYGRNIANGVDVFTSIEQLQDLSLDDLKALIERINLVDNSATYTIIPR